MSISKEQWLYLHDQVRKLDAEEIELQSKMIAIRKKKTELIFRMRDWAITRFDAEVTAVWLQDEDDDPT